MLATDDHRGRDTSTMSSTSLDDLINRWIYAHKEDSAEFVELYGPDTQLWHSGDNAWKPAKEGTIAGLKALRSAGLRHPPFGDMKIIRTESGFLSLTVLERAQDKRLHLAQVVTVVDGRITAVQEYIAPEMGLVPLPTKESPVI
ncbi:MAG TPA: hypothetical protein VN154_04220 [Rhizomicrobium sp.]|nr:hypothetical protein [Rhizomicrobium sp.]